MGYSKEVNARANEILSHRRQKAFYDAEERREEIYKKLPRVREIERLLTRTGIAAAKAVLAGSDTKTELMKLRDANLLLQGELKTILALNGYKSEDLEEQYKCMMCSDKGYIDGRICQCKKKLLRDLVFQEINKLSPLSLSSFDTFSLDYYSDQPNETGHIPRKRIEKIYNFCKNYAENFNGTGPSVFMAGGTGLGKTHLSLAIARRVIEKGYGVIYCSAPKIMEELANEHFSSNTPKTTLNHLIECDLLIFDDLGTEQASKYTVTEIYNLFNTRMLYKRPTIVNTNLSLKELTAEYGKRLISRVAGDHVYFEFIGKDIRIIKNRLQFADY